MSFACAIPRGARCMAVSEASTNLSEEERARAQQDAVRCRKVEDALFRRACGYKVTLHKSVKLKRIEYDADTGKKVSEREELEMGKEEQHIPADLRVCAYFLNNRDPARWRDDPQAVGEEADGVVAFPNMEAPTCAAPTEEEEEREP